MRRPPPTYIGYTPGRTYLRLRTREKTALSQRPTNLAKLSYPASTNIPKVLPGVGPVSGVGF